MEQSLAIRVSGLSKTFKVNKNILNALTDISFEIREGEFVALLGPNGAGKSTLIKILIGVLAYDKGSVSILGQEPLENRENIVARLGIVFGQRSRLWYDLPVRDSFELTSRLYGNKNLDWENYLIDGVDIRKLLDRQVKKLSLGEKMRCELVNTLLYNPDLIFLDEPTIGLDVVSKQKIREFLHVLHKQGKTILLTSHDTGDIEKLCERVIVINNGEMVVDLLIADFMSLDTKSVLILKLNKKPSPKYKIKFSKFILEIKKISDYEVRIECLKTDFKKVLVKALDVFDVQDLDFESGGVEKILIELYDK
ncbi:MAG: ATP-binding cassette domain-containing protein [Patescibacteria group bacterium]